MGAIATSCEPLVAFVEAHREHVPQELAWRRANRRHERRMRKPAAMATIEMAMMSCMLSKRCFASPSADNDCCEFGLATDAKRLSQNRLPRGGQAHFAAKSPQNEPVPDGSGISANP